MKRRVAALVLAAVALIAATGAALTGPAPAAKALPEPDLATATPVLSARRVSTLLVGAVANASLTHVLDGIMAQLPPRSCLDVVVGGRTLYQRNVTEPLSPASDEKLLTATAALELLGPEHRFTTSVVAAQPAADGVIAGDIWLVGGGDPLLATKAFLAHFRDQPRIATSLESLADAVVAAGVRHVDGSVVGDGSRYDSQPYVSSWPLRYVAQHQTGPLSALTVNDNFTSWTTPEPLDGDPGAVPAADPPQAAAATFAQLLQARGVTIGGAPKSGTAPAHGSSVAHIESPPLRSVLTEMLQESDNQTAETLTKELGLRVSGTGSTAAGVAAITAELDRLGLPLTGTTRVDGSGLDTADKVTCGLLADVLDRAGPASPLAAALPVAGESGTLRDRMKGTPAAGRVRAKTGTLPTVSALSGFVATRPGTTVTFSFIADGATATTRTEALEDAIAEALIAYPAGVDLAAAGPLKP